MSRLNGPASSEREGSTQDELTPLMQSTPQQNCRKSRLHTRASHWGFVKTSLSYILRFTFWSSGFNRHKGVWTKIYSFSILCLCWYQVVYEAARNAGYWNFGNYHNTTDITKNLEYVSFLSSAIGTACSYTCMLLCLKLMYKSKSNAISPYVALRDMGNTKARIILFTWIPLSVTFVAYIMLYVYIHAQDGDTLQRVNFIKYWSGVCEFLGQWVALVSMFAFSCSAFAIGTFASDTFRRIKALSGGSIDDVITIHKELRAIVSETTNAFSAWFLMHWLLFGVTVIIGFVVVALHKLGKHTSTDKKIYYGTFFAISTFSFVFPCICAAYITTACAAIPSRINNTISADWEEGHIFKERKELQLFVSYCAASPVCFKIGRITFTSTLAWFSFFFGSTGLLFHFF